MNKKSLILIAAVSLVLLAIVSVRTIINGASDGTFDGIESGAYIIAAIFPALVFISRLMSSTNEDEE